MRAAGRAPLRWSWCVILAVGCKSAAPTEPAPGLPAPPPASAPIATGPEEAEPIERQLPAGQARPPALALGTRGGVTSAEAHASDVGIAVLERGGNAVDAAVAVAFALAVTHPSAGNVGGGGFMVIRMAGGETAAIDYRETAPQAAHRDMYLDKAGKPTKESLVGPKAAGIPGTVAGLALAHERHGTLPWRDLVLPAVALARDGHRLDRHHAEDLARGAKRAREGKLVTSAAYFEKPGGVAYAEGETWKQPELAATLLAVADEGPRAFYEGPLAESMAASVRRDGGIWEASDLAAYRAKDREPIRFTYRGHEIVTMPPPSGGGVVLRQLLAASEILDLASRPWRSPEEVHLFVEASRRTYADRNFLLGDPDFIDLPLQQLLDVEYVRGRLSNIDPARATPSTEIAAGSPARAESEETTHFSIIDADGNAVSNTYTLNTGFGSSYVVPGTGVLLNNEMDDFAVKPGSPNVFGLVQGEQNRIEPGKRMLSSMTPTIVTKDGRVRAVVGSPGGPTISTTVVQIVRALLDYGLPMDAAVASVRTHHQWLPDAIWTEESIPPALEKSLEGMGHSIRKRRSIGHANCIEVDPTSQGFRVVADVERDGGKAAAY